MICYFNLSRNLFKAENDEFCHFLSFPVFLAGHNQAKRINIKKKPHDVSQKIYHK